MSDEHEPGLVSVIVPTFNRVDFLIEAMDSVFDQSYCPIELIVIDDGSTDSTKIAVAEWTKNHNTEKRFNLRLLSQENKGGSAARNLGLIESRGEFIQFLDSDDILLSKKIEIQVYNLKADPECDFVWSDWAYVKNSNVRDCKKKYEAEAISPCIGQPISCENLKYLPAQIVMGVYRRMACIQNGPLNEALIRLQDWEYTTRFLVLKPKVRYVKGIFYLVRLHENGRVEDLEGTRKGNEARMQAGREVERVISERNIHDPIVLKRIAYNYFIAGMRAIRLGRRDQVVQAFSELTRLMMTFKDLRFYLRMKLTIYTYNCLGGSAAVFVHSVLQATWDFIQRRKKIGNVVKD